jgi:pilus assembly protein Flp/PilA
LGISRVHSFCQRLLRDESAATVIEYGLLIGLIAAAIVAGLSDFSDQLVNTYVIVSTWTNTAQAKEQ